MRRPIRNPCGDVASSAIAHSTRSRRPLMIDRLLAAYRNEGRAGVRRKLTWGYRQLITQYVRPVMPATTRICRLSGVEVPIDVSVIDERLPGYEPPLPIRDNPSYEQAEAEALRAQCEPGDDVVVIGGGLGVTAVIAARATGPTGRVTVYEPSPNAVRIVRDTVRWNACGDTVDVIHAAVGTARASCYTHGDPTSPRSVPYTQLPNADVYEMDCEGEEEPILRAMTAEPRAVLVETHDNHNTVVSTLQERGYNVERVRESGSDARQRRTHVTACHRS